MAKFQKKKSGGAPGISTASLPDIVFMLLFFFMVVTTMREVSLKVKNVTPQATEVEKLGKKSLVSYIYVGPPIEQLKGKFGTASRIQLNDAFKPLEEIGPFVQSEKEKIRPSWDQDKMIVSIKADKDVKMGIVTDVKQELRKANALKISYSAKKGAKKPS